MITELAYVSLPLTVTKQIKSKLVGWLVVLSFTALSDSISVYIGPSPRERQSEKRNDRREKKCPNNPHHPHLLRAQ